MSLYVRMSTQESVGTITVYVQYVCASVCVE